ncbi:uncharacterized protein LOC112494162 [Cephus cinctus]|uniref:Uncharacterized protein LOC112494162 n=1 Tax=Cephus cinctus TaxID=211228 RepID=A0AAJ7W0G2_CEPCN|nr:uncharacterized protein LOC112494162 [Cephus cinctus]
MMKSLIFVLCVTAMILCAESAPKTSCVKNTNACVRSAECCTGCCHEEKCVSFSESCLSDLTQLGAGVKGGPCALLDPPCTAGHQCVLQPVQCIQSPCPPIASCVPPDYHDYD